MRAFRSAWWVAAALVWGASGEAAASDCAPGCIYELCDHRDSENWAVAEGMVTDEAVDGGYYGAYPEVQVVAVRGRSAEMVEVGSRHTFFAYGEELAVGRRVLLLFTGHDDQIGLTRSFLADEERRIDCMGANPLDLDRALDIASSSDCPYAAERAGWRESDCGCGCAAGRGSGAEAAAGALAVAALFALRRRR